MYITIANVLYYCTVPALLYFYYGSLFAKPFKWYICLLYTAISFCFTLMEAQSFVTGYMNVILAIAVLAFFGIAFLKCGVAPSFCAAALVVSTYSIITGIIQSVLHWVISSISAQEYAIMQYLDIVQFLLTIALIIATFWLIKRLFDGRMAETYRLSFLLVGIPVFFIALVENTVSTNIYGNTVVWDSEKGLILPIVNNEELIILQIIAFAGLFCTLFTYKRLITAIYKEQAMKQISQQAQDQRIYVREAQARYAQTRSFRHDIKNHLLVLRQLLDESKPKEAAAYLQNLEQASASLSYSVSTGNTVVDALLGSKLAAAVQQEAAVECSLAIPPSSSVEDMDWCIILSNALDNAIAAGKAIPPANRYIHVSSAQKGNVFMLWVENACRFETPPPSPGIGLGNIKSVAQKYGGDIEIDISAGVFTLNVLLVISQQ